MKSTSYRKKYIYTYILKFQETSITITLRETWPYLHYFRSEFSRIGTEYEEIPHTSPYLAPMRKNTDQKNSKYSCICKSFSCISHPKLKKAEKKPPEKNSNGNGTFCHKYLKTSYIFLCSQKRKFLAQILQKFLIFFQKKAFLLFSQKKAFLIFSKI